MGTRFRTMLAPIGLPTGDGRRFAEGGISLADLPFSMEWVRQREGGHDGAVAVGAVQQAHVGTVAEAIANDWISADAVGSMRADMTAVWASGELYDDIDREAMPRLAEDVAEVMHLMSKGTLGPSVDLDSFEGVPVMPGTDEPVTEQAFEAHYAEFGQEPKLELLITQGRVRAATLVSIPAFAETSRPLELIPNEAGAPALALIASVEAVRNTHCSNCGDTRGGPVGHEAYECSFKSAAAFDGAALTGPTPITYDTETGRIFGHIATWRTCHVGYSDVCVTAPKDPTGGDYASFNRYPVETEDGVVWAGRITVGGRHAALSANAGGAIAEHDDKRVAGYVRAYEDEFGIAVAGRMEPDLTEGDFAILSRRKVSGDWRETANGLALVEVLALAPGPRQHSEPGFPIETFSRGGRQVALTAALGPEPGGLAQFANPEHPDVKEFAREFHQEMLEIQARREAAQELSTTIREAARPAREALLAELNKGK